MNNSYYSSRYFNKSLYDNYSDYYLLEEANNDMNGIKNLVNNGLDSKNISAKCIKTFKALTYEMEKVVDILIKLIEQSNSKSKDLPMLKRFKDDLDDLKSYSMQELTIDKFQLDIRDIYKKIGSAIKDFGKVVIKTADSNKVEDKLAKAMSRIPPLVIDCYTAVEEYTKVQQNNLSSIRNKIGKANTSSNRKYVKAVQEELSYFYNPYYETRQTVLSEKDEKPASGFFVDTVAGMKKPFSFIHGLFTSSNSEELVEKLDGAANSLSRCLSRLWNTVSVAEGDIKDKKGNNVRGTNYWIKTKAFFTSPDLHKLVGAAVVAAAIFIGIRSLYRKARDWIQSKFQ